MNEELPRRVSARAGLEWVLGSFRLFFKSPLILAAGAAMSLGALLILQLIPVVGAGLSEIIMPLLVAGFMRVYRTIDEGQEAELGHLMAGFQQAARPLAMIGAFYLGLIVILLMLMKALGVDYEGMMQQLQQGVPMEHIAAELQGKSLLLLLGTALVLLAVSTTWLAPALVLFGQASPLQAMTLSVKGCLRNWPAMLVNSLAMLPALLLAFIPIVGWLVLLPVALGTAYLGYQAMFATQVTDN